jgi:hypothetical protein
MKIFKKIKKQKNGFAMLFTVLIISVILAIATSVADLGYKELLLSSVSRDSQYAFYAADAGTECALYEDFKAKIFDAAPPATISCFGKTVNIVPIASGYELQTKAGFGNNMTDSCFGAVDITQTIGSGNSLIDIMAHGQNVCDTTNPRQVERGLEVSYTR